MYEIKVEPYWNVKIKQSLAPFTNLSIKVEPYWNVKRQLEDLDFKLQ